MRLRGSRYDEIERTVISLFENIQIESFPLDCFEICEQLGFMVIPYYSLSEKKRKACKEVSEDGFSLIIETTPGEYTYEIYYNNLMPHHRIRFTIMHEIGHIILDHSEHSDLAESEANYFAKYALAPPPLINRLEIEDYLELADCFDLSHECALYSMKKYNKWLMYGPSKLLDHETALITLFQPVLFS